MRKSAITAVAFCSVLGGSLMGGITAAQTPPATVVADHDKDNDQTLDLAEVKAAAGARFDKLNKDTDQTLETHEVKGVIGNKMFAAADTDHDGSLSKDEYLALVEKLFKETDIDHDGTLSVNELKSKSGQMLIRLIH